MRRAQGYAVITDPSKAQPIERDTITCCHCGKVVFVKPLADPSEMGGFCRLCMKNICSGCATRGECTPFEKRLEQMEQRDRMFRAIGV